MAIPDELLDLAKAGLDAGEPEATLRRATSSAYYALFHLLVSAATENWETVQFRPLLGRVFEHGKMRSACERLLRTNATQNKQRAGLPFDQRTPADHIRIVAETFIQAQELREIADCDMSTTWNQSNTAVQVEQVADAFRSWKAVREEPEAQKLLVMMLGPKQRASRT